jgi:hypothetical protein
MRQQNVMRNRAIVVLRKVDPKMFSFGHLSELFGVQKHVIHKVFERDKGKYELAVESSVNSKEN